MRQIHVWLDKNWVLVRMSELKINSIFKFSDSDAIHMAKSEPLLKDGVWEYNQQIQHGNL